MALPRPDAIHESIINNFVKSPPLDISIGKSSKEMVEGFAAGLAEMGVPIRRLEDLAQVFYLLQYQDDDSAAKIFALREDILQTPRATLFLLRGDCEDQHHLYQSMAYYLRLHSDPKLLVVTMIKDSKELKGHAITVYPGSPYKAQDYAAIIEAENLQGILSYLSKTYWPVYTYDLLKLKVASGEPKLKPDRWGSFDGKITEYKVVFVDPKPEVQALAKSLHRSREFEKDDKSLKLAGFAIAGLILGVILSDIYS